MMLSVSCTRRMINAITTRAMDEGAELALVRVYILATSAAFFQAFKHSNFDPQSVWKPSSFAAQSISLRINFDLPQSFNFIMYRFMVFLCTSLLLIMPSLAVPLPEAISAPIVEAIPKAKRETLSVGVRDAAAQGTCDN